MGFATDLPWRTAPTVALAAWTAMLRAQAKQAERGRIDLVLTKEMLAIVPSEISSLLHHPLNSPTQVTSQTIKELSAWMQVSHPDQAQALVRRHFWSLQLWGTAGLLFQSSSFADRVEVYPEPDEEWALLAMLLELGLTQEQLHRNLPPVRE